MNKSLQSILFIIDQDFESVYEDLKFLIENSGKGIDHFFAHSYDSDVGSSGQKVKGDTFSDISKFIGLPERVVAAIARAFVRESLSESSACLGSITDGKMNDIVIFYFKERLSWIGIISFLIRLRENEDHSHLSEIKSLLDGLFLKETSFVSSIVKNLNEFLPLSKESRSYRNVLDPLHAREHKSLLELLFLICYRTHTLPLDFLRDHLRLLESYPASYQGDLSLVDLVKDSSFLHVILILENLNLEILTNENCDSEFFRCNFGEKIQVFRDINDEIGSMQVTENTLHKAFLQFIWGCFLCRLASLEITQDFPELLELCSEKIMGVEKFKILISKAFDNGFLEYLKNTFSHSSLFQDNSPNVLGIKCVIDGIFSVFMEDFKIDNVPLPLSFLEILCSLYEKNEALVEEFWLYKFQDEENQVKKSPVLLALSLFPAHSDIVMRYFKCMASTASGALYVFDLLDSLRNVTVKLGPEDLSGSNDFISSSRDISIFPGSSMVLRRGALLELHPTYEGLGSVEMNYSLWDVFPSLVVNSNNTEFLESLFSLLYQILLNLDPNGLDTTIARLDYHTRDYGGFIAFSLSFLAKELLNHRRLSLIDSLSKAIPICLERQPSERINEFLVHIHGPVMSSVMKRDKILPIISLLRLHSVFCHLFKRNFLTGQSQEFVGGQRIFLEFLCQIYVRDYILGSEFFAQNPSGFEFYQRLFEITEIFLEVSRRMQRAGLEEIKMNLDIDRVSLAIVNCLSSLSEYCESRSYMAYSGLQDIIQNATISCGKIVSYLLLLPGTKDILSRYLMEWNSLKHLLHLGWILPSKCAVACSESIVAIFDEIGRYAGKLYDDLIVQFFLKMTFSSQVNMDDYFCAFDVLGSVVAIDCNFMSRVLVGKPKFHKKILAYASKFPKNYKVLAALIRVFAVSHSIVKWDLAVVMKELSLTKKEVIDDVDAIWYDSCLRWYISLLSQDAENPMVLAELSRVITLLKDLNDTSLDRPPKMEDPELKLLERSRQSLPERIEGIYGFTEQFDVCIPGKEISHKLINYQCSSLSCKFNVLEELKVFWDIVRIKKIAFQDKMISDFFGYLRGSIKSLHRLNSYSSWKNSNSLFDSLTSVILLCIENKKDSCKVSFPDCLNDLLVELPTATEYPSQMFHIVLLYLLQSPETPQNRALFLNIAQRCWKELSIMKSFTEAIVTWMELLSFAALVPQKSDWSTEFPTEKIISVLMFSGSSSWTIRILEIFVRLSMLPDNHRYLWNPQNYRWLLNESFLCNFILGRGKDGTLSESDHGKRCQSAVLRYVTNLIKFHRTEELNEFCASFYNSMYASILAILQVRDHGNQVSAGFGFDELDQVLAISGFLKEMTNSQKPWVNDYHAYGTSASILCIGILKRLVEMLTEEEPIVKKNIDCMLGVIRELCGCLLNLYGFEVKTCVPLKLVSMILFKLGSLRLSISEIPEIKYAMEAIAIIGILERRDCLMSNLGSSHDTKQESLNDFHNTLRMTVEKGYLSNDFIVEPSF